MVFFLCYTSVVVSTGLKCILENNLTLTSATESTALLLVNMITGTLNLQLSIIFRTSSYESIFVDTAKTDPI